MKIAKILGIVFAVHALGFVIIFANPGCSSTASKSKAAPAPVDTTASDPVVTPAPVPMPSADSKQPDTMSAAALNPPVASSPMVSFAPGAHVAPTRPGTAAAASLEPVAPVEATPVTTYVVGKGESLWTIAKKKNISVNDLAKANGLTPKSSVKVGSKLIIPGKSTPSASAPSAVAETAETYKVKAGDTLAAIAKKNGTTGAALRAANNLKSDLLKVGQELKLPSGASAAAPGEVPASASVVAVAPVADKHDASGALTHTVKPGETLGAIAKKYKVRPGELATANNIADPAKLRVGQDLIIPGGKGAVEKPVAGTTTAVLPAASAPNTSTASDPAYSPIKIQLTPPPASEDLDAGLKNQPTTDAPVIKVDDTGAPKLQ